MIYLEFAPRMRRRAASAAHRDCMRSTSRADWISI